MTTNSHDTDALYTKIREMFAEGFGEASRKLRLCAEEHLADAIARALALPKDKALDAAFHLSDWRREAAALLAISLAPERFTSEEIEECLMAFLIHAPNHIAAAAKIAGFSPSDIFKTA